TDYPNLPGTRPTASTVKKEKRKNKKYLPVEKSSRVLRLRNVREKQGCADVDVDVETTGEYGSVVDVQRLEYEYRGQRGFFLPRRVKIPHSGEAPPIGPYCGSVAPVSANRGDRVKISLARFQTRHLLAQTAEKLRVDRENEENTDSVSFVRRLLPIESGTFDEMKLGGG
ncbi:hypothetical protein K0M31_011218, partial [Melipona bicolor]